MSPDGITPGASLSTQMAVCGCKTALPRRTPVEIPGQTLVSCRLMEEKLLTADAAGSLPLWFLTESELPRWLTQQPAPVASWIRASPNHRYPHHQSGHHNR